MRWISFVLLAALPVLAGCGESMRIDLEQARAEIRQADLDLNDALAGRDADAFRALVADDAKFYGTRLLSGGDAVASGWSVFMDEASGLSLAWAPDVAVVAASGDLGYTRGRYELKSPGEDGETMSQFGYYVSIWRKGEDGRWRAAVDIGTPPAADPVPEG